MKEIHNILEAYRHTDFSERNAVLASVVKVSGSSYRNPGARMLILDNGRWIGSISGGCLEGDAMRKAISVMRDKKPMLVTYDTMDDENNTLGVGLGCNGIIDILLEPVDNKEQSKPIDHLKDLISFKGIGVSALVFHSEDKESTKEGDRILLKPNDIVDHKYGTGYLNKLIEKDLVQSLSSKTSQTKSYNSLKGSIEVLFEIIEPNIELLIFGAGADAQPVTQLAKALGWHVRVSDECIAHLAPANFPAADEMISCQRKYVKKEVEINPYTAIIVMSHNYDYDLEVLKQIVASPSPYIGILGPKKRTEKLFDALRKAKINLTQTQKNRIHTPIGLDIGAETADEIALSILSEILAIFSGRSGGFLKYHNGPIHKRYGSNNQVFKQVYLNHSNESQEIG
ncbi:MAG: XdhC family protein [Reichenbachiella sp.]